jgi:glycosyltransferase involved in cell wall biosynthesis
MNKIKVLFVQRTLPHYRIAFFKALASVPDVDFTMALQTKCELESPPPFNIIHVTSKKLGPFHLTKNLAEHASTFDVIFVPFDLHEIGGLQLLFKRKFNGRIILFGHSHGRRKALQVLRRWLTRRAAAVLVYTDLGRQKLIAENTDPEKIFVSNNTIAVQNASFAKSTHKKSFLFVGRLTRRKQVSELITAFGLARPHIAQDITVDIIGEGEELENLRLLTSKLGLGDCVNFHGKVLDDDLLKDFFHRSFAYVSPGHVGLGVVHSFAYGTPVVTTNHNKHAPEFSYVENGYSGVLYNGSKEELKNTLIQLATNQSFNLALAKNSFHYFQNNLQLTKTAKNFKSAVEYCVNL